MCPGGVGLGENVAILMCNRHEFVEAFPGIQKLGACAVSVNFRLSQEEVAYVLADSRAVATIDEQELAGAPYEEALAGLVRGPDVDVSDEQLAFLVCTSGTTGRGGGADRALPGEAGRLQEALRRRLRRGAAAQRRRQGAEAGAPRRARRDVQLSSARALSICAWKRCMPPSQRAGSAALRCM